MIDEVVPDLALFEGGFVADNEQEMPRSCYGNIESPFVDQKSETALEGLRIVTPDTIENDDVLFSSLEGVDRVDFDRLFELNALVSTKASKLVLDVPHLCFVRSYYTE